MAKPLIFTEFKVTRKGHFGYVGPVKRSSTLIKVDGITIARVAESQRRAGHYFAEFSFNGGRTYSWSWGAGPDKADVIAKAEKEVVRIAKDLANEK